MFGVTKTALLLKTHGPTGKDGKVVDEGKSIEIYKMEDGKWKLFRDCYNSNMPAMPPAK